MSPSTLRFALALTIGGATLGCHYHDYHGGCDHDDDDRIDECFGPWCDDDELDAGAATDDGGPAEDGGLADGGPATSGCGDASDCAEGEVCVEASCRPVDDTCHFDHDCGGGRACVDNACRPRCAGDAECRDGTACDGGVCRPTAECASDADCDGARCVDARCLDACATDDDCGPEALCAAGVCRPDVAPRPFCATDGDCAPGHLCVFGVCRTPCPTGEDDECLRWDRQLVRCGASESGLLLCYTHHESNPECRVAADCAATESCVDAICTP